MLTRRRFTEFLGHLVGIMEGRLKRLINPLAAIDVGRDAFEA
jgi:hypothetical protein